MAKDAGPSQPAATVGRTVGQPVIDHKRILAQQVLP
jgi:hypothetical protein